MNVKKGKTAICYDASEQTIQECKCEESDDEDSIDNFVESLRTISNNKTKMTIERVINLKKKDDGQPAATIQKAKVTAKCKGKPGETPTCEVGLEFEF